MSKPKCPKCKAPMVKRKGKYGEFWGCSNYARTKCDSKPRKKGMNNATLWGLLALFGLVLLVQWFFGTLKFL